MRVAHVDHGSGPEPRRSLAVRPQIHPPRVGHSMLKRNGGPRKARRTHVDPIGPGSETLACDDSGLGLDAHGADPQLAAQPIRHATRAVAARANERPIVVIDQHVGRGSCGLRIAEHHHLIVAEARRPVDGARVFRGRTHGRAAQVEHENGVASPIHARDRAISERMARYQALASFWSSSARRPTQAGRPVDRSGAELRHRVAQAVIGDRRGGGARRGFSCVRGDWCGPALLLERRQRALPEGDLVDASPAEMRVRPSHDHRGAVLRLERERAFHPQHQGRASDRRVRIAFGGPGRPLQLDGSGMTREGLADDGRPIGDQACFAQTARGQCLGDQPGSEFSQRLGAASRALHHRLGTESKKAGHEVDGMSANVSALASEAKRKAIVARTLAWWDRSRRSLAWRAEPGEIPDPYRVWLSEVLLQQTTAQAVAPYYHAFTAKWPTVEDLALAAIEDIMSEFAGLGY